MGQEADIAVLRERADQAEKEREELRKQHAEMIESMRRMEGLLTRYKGFIGGIVFLWSCIWAAAAMTWEVWTRWISK